MAEKKLAQIGDEIEARWPGTITTIVHRIGPLQISDIAVLIAVSSPIVKMHIELTNMLLNVSKKSFQFGKRKFGKTVQSGKDIKEVATI